MLSVWVLEEDEDDNKRDSSDREVDKTGCTSAIEDLNTKGVLAHKHQRHDTLSVNTPPRIGPTTLEIPNMLERSAM